MSLLDGFLGMKVEAIIVSGGGGCKLVRDVAIIFSLDYNLTFYQHRVSRASFCQKALLVLFPVN